MYKIRMFCDDNDKKYYDEFDGRYETYDQALIACFRLALEESRDLAVSNCEDAWFEMETDFEITPTYANELLENVGFFPVAVVFYDRAPWDSENDCNIKIVTGYTIEEISETEGDFATSNSAKDAAPKCVGSSNATEYQLEECNKWLRARHGENITVVIKKASRGNGFYFTSRKYGRSKPFSSVEEAYKEADIYLGGVGELW